jgi:DNA-binding response OmpR family regulator
MYNILICDDELDIVRALKIYLTDPGYTFFEAHNGQEALEIVSNEEIHLILMDVMMPVMDGIEATAKLRTFSNVPIIFLTAKSEEADMLLGLNIGADDYITKPFNPMEVSARVRSHLRRYMLLGGGNIRQDVLRIGNIELDDRAKAVTVDGDPISLTPTEYEILKLLMQNPGQVFPPKSIYQTIWKETPSGCENTVAVHIRHIREKVEITPAEPRYLKAVWGQGYKIES